MRKSDVAPLDFSKSLARVGELCGLMVSWQIQRILSEHLLTPEQLSRAELATGIELVGMGDRSKKIIETRAVAELARIIDLIVNTEAVGLRSIVDRSGMGLTVDTPYWDRDCGELRFKGSVIRRIYRPSAATNIVRILDAFQKQNWPARINDPLPDAFDSQRLREAIASLNKGLRQIRFRADGYGQGVVWDAR